MKNKFLSSGKVSLVKIVVCENRGWNFGLFLVYFVKELLEYDLMCYVYFKKLFYSGRE